MATCKQTVNNNNSQENKDNHRFILPKPAIQTKSRTCVKSTQKADRKYRCKECPRVFPYWSALKKHNSLVHTPKQSEEEQESHDVIPGRLILPKTEEPKISRTRKPSTSRLYRCRECPETFKRYEAQRKHEELNHWEVHNNLSVCHYCCSLYENADALDRHVRETHADGQFVCRSCPKRYGSKGYLINHMAAVHQCETMQYYCTLCPVTYKFHSLGILQKHFQEMHLLKPSIPFDIGIATNVEILEEYLNCQDLVDNWDMSDVLDTDGPKGSDAFFKCPKCLARCANVKHLLHHFAVVHFMDMLFCNLCNARFNKYGKLKEHLDGKCPKRNGYKHRVDSPSVEGDEEDVITCPYCHKAFATAIVFKRHLRAIHTMCKKQTCEFCDRHFSTGDHLKKHVLSFHLNERKYECETCQSSFTQQCHWKRHISNKNGCKSNCE